MKNMFQHTEIFKQNSCYNCIAITVNISICWVCINLLSGDLAHAKRVIKHYIILLPLHNDYLKGIKFRGYLISRLEKTYILRVLLLLFGDCKKSHGYLISRFQ